VIVPLIHAKVVGCYEVALLTLWLVANAESLLVKNMHELHACGSKQSSVMYESNSRTADECVHWGLSEACLLIR
jgi:hypothetical protein